MKILLWHGYLLTGSGSNVYTANIARSYRHSGHDVVVMCQERAALEDLDFVDADGDLTDDNRSVELGESLGIGSATGRCRVVRPAIGRLLPVYVFDRYEGFDARLFVDLTEAELNEYVERNVAAMVTVLTEFEPDVVITGHEVMGPFIAKRACERTGSAFVAKLHGSALEYAVKRQERYRSYASEGLSAAAAVAGGSRYMVEEAARHIPGWRHKAVVVNPGCDVEIFTPLARTGSAGVVGFVGKLMAPKGVHHLLAALPLVEGLRRAVIVGYGGFEAGLRGLAAALRAGDLQRLREIAAAGEAGPLEHMIRWFEDPPPGYLDAAATLEIEFTGRLEHGPLSRVLPSFDVLAVPSVVPEAFGMVAAEAAAAGVLPVVPGHSGIGEAGAAVEEAIGRPGWLTFDPDDPIVSLAQALTRVLLTPIDERREMEAAAVRLARSRWSWHHVADALLELAH
ncbi:MAG TPA: glycosyltransferase family 4 protein [Actinomycetota bacterium]|nr:glycosyltransferase family 4 protein [Actinomycetota bacterium]